MISIIIPCYNSEKYIVETINSVLAQTYQNLEIIVVDDNSTDNSVNIIKTFKDPRIKLIQQKNQGAAVARNTGIQHSKGDFIQFLDADDIISSNKLEVQLNSIYNIKNAIAVCQTIHFFDNQNHLKIKPNEFEKKFLYTADKPIDFLLNLWGINDSKRGSMIQTNAWLIPKALIDLAGNWATHYSPDDDGEFFARMICYSSKIVYSNNCFNYYRKFKKKNSLSSLNSKKAIEGVYTSIQLKEKCLANFINQTQLKDVIGHQLENIIISSYINHKLLYKQIIKKYPYKKKFKYNLPLGGNVINTINELLGWKIAVKLQKIRSYIK